MFSYSRVLEPLVHCSLQSRDLAAISPTGTGKTLSYLLPVMSALRAPSSSDKSHASGARALVVAPTRELAHQIHNECLKLAQGRKWRIVLFNKANANSLANKSARDLVGQLLSVASLWIIKIYDSVDIIIATPLRLVASLQTGSLELHKCVSVIQT
jgi:ATP-dependent RNA helicase DDX52/ROK1